MTLSEMGAMLKALVAKSDATQTLAAEITDLKAQLSAANTAKATAETALADHKAQLAAKDTSAAELKAAKEKAEADLVAANTAKDAAEAKAKQLVDEPSAVALELAARAGVKPEQRPKGEAGTQAKTKTLTEFEAMSHSARNEFMRSGGKIVN